MTKAEEVVLAAAKKRLEDYLNLKGVKDWHVLDEQTAHLVMAISTFKVWQSWRSLADIVGDIA